MLAEKCGNARGVRFTPRLYESPCSGLRLTLPPSSCPHCSAAHCLMVLVEPPLPYSAGVTPVCSHAANDAVAGTSALVVGSRVGAHGSMPGAAISPLACGEKSSSTFGARIAR